MLDRRLGIPLSLSLLTIEVGRRCGVDVEGIGMPGHYLVRPAGEPDRFLDVYDGGRELDVEGCHALFERVQAGVPWDEALPPARRAVGSRRPARSATWPAPTAAPATASRCAGRCELSLLLPSGSDRERRELGLLLGASGRYAEAADRPRGLRHRGRRRGRPPAARAPQLSAPARILTRWSSTVARP